MTLRHRVALSGDFFDGEGRPAYRDFDLAPLADDPAIDLVTLPRGPRIESAWLEEVDALILLAPRLDAASLPRSGRLGVVARFGVGFDNVDVPACTAAGVAVAITPDAVRRPVAVAILTLMLALAGRLIDKDRITRQGPDGFARRAAFMGRGLVGRTLGSVGLGNIAQEMFRLAAPFGMRFIAHDPMPDAAAARALGVQLVPLDEVFRHADVVTVNCPLNPATRHLVDARRIALMQPSAFLINTARGAIVDQAALVEALAGRRIAGAGLDVFDPEPPAADDPLLGLDNVVLAPHALSWTDQGFAAIGASAIAAVRATLRGLRPAHLVDGAVCDTPAWRARSDALRARERALADGA
jgi:phosphoglycerate dehydrogenase-like enzyme